MRSDPPPMPYSPPDGPAREDADIRPGWGMLALTALLAAPLSGFFGAMGTIFYGLLAGGDRGDYSGGLLIMVGSVGGAVFGLLAAWAWWAMMRGITTAAPPLRWRYRHFVWVSLGRALAVGAAAGGATHLAMQLTTGRFWIDILLLGVVFGLSAGFWLGLLLAWPWSAIVRNRLDQANLLPEDAYV